MNIISKKRQVCPPSSATRAVGPYSQAIQYGDIIFCSGIIALDPETGQVAGEDIETQTCFVLDSLSKLLSDIGTDIKNVLKTTVFLKNMDDFQAFNAVYDTYFTENPPARSAVEAARLPLDVLVEVEAIVAIP